MTTVDTWIKGARPRTLPAAITPVFVATALAGSEINMPRALLALMVSLSLQVGVNYANDYSDGIRGTDTDRVGPIRIVASGLAAARAVKFAAYCAFFVAGVAGFTLAAMTSWWLLLVGASAISAAWYYTGGGSPYGYMGFGEISVFIFFGLVATIGTFYVQSEHITLKSFIVSVPLGALSCSLLAINNIRDRARDEVVGKRTLAVRLGENCSRRFYAGLLILTHVVVLFVSPWAVITLAAFPLSLHLIREVIGGKSGRELIPLLVKTGQLQLLFALLLATALWLS